MADVGTLTVRIDADTAALASGIGKAQAQVQAAGEKMKSVGSGFTSLGTKLSLGITAPLALLAKMGADELDQIQQANSRTAAAIKRVGAESMLSVGGINKMAAGLQQLSGQDDQIIQMGQNFLLTFGSIHANTKEGAKLFGTASRVMVDFAEATNQSADAAGKQLAKSLASASQGVLLLPRGMKLGAEETAKLQKVFKETADPTARQAALMEVLGKKVQGASHLTDAERWGNLKDNLAGLSASIIEQLMPAIESIVSTMDKWITRFNEMDPATKKVVAIVAVLAAALGPLLIVIGSLVGALGVLAVAEWAAIAPIAAIVVAIAVLIAIGVLLYQNWDTIKQKCEEAWNAVKAAVVASLDAIKSGIQAAWDFIKSATTATWDAIKTAVSAAMAFMQSALAAAWAAIKGAATTAWDAVRTTISGAWDGIKTAISTTVGQIGTIIRAGWTAISGAASSAWSAISGVISGVWSGISGAIDGVVDAIGSNLRGAWTSVRGAAFSGWTSVKEAIINGIEGAPAKIVGLFSGLAGDMLEKGKAAGSALASALAGAIRSISLPSISIDMKSFTIPGTDKSFSVPSGISWNAAGGIFNGAQVIGVGESGPEAVVPLGGSAKNRADRARVMNEAGLTGGGGVTQNFIFNTPTVDMFAASRAALFGMRSVGIG